VQQTQARTHPGVLGTQKALLALFHTSSPDSPVSVNTPISYYDRLRIRFPGDAIFALGEHIDGGSLERWEDPGASLVLSSARAPSPPDRAQTADDRVLLFAQASARAGARSLPVGPSRTCGTTRGTSRRGSTPRRACTRRRASAPSSACSRVRLSLSLLLRLVNVLHLADEASPTGWTALSNTAPGEGTLRVFPDVSLATAYLVLRPFFRPRRGHEGKLGFDDWEVDVESTDFPGSVKGKGASSSSFSSSSSSSSELCERARHGCPSSVAACLGRAGRRALTAYRVCARRSGALRQDAPAPAARRDDDERADGQARLECLLALRRCV